MNKIDKILGMDDPKVCIDKDTSHIEKWKCRFFLVGIWIWFACFCIREWFSKKATAKSKLRSWKDEFKTLSKIKK